MNIWLSFNAVLSFLLLMCLIPIRDQMCLTHGTTGFFFMMHKVRYTGIQVLNLVIR